MIPQTSPQVEPSKNLVMTTPLNDEQLWRQAFANSFRDAQTLLRFLEFPEQQIKKLLADEQGFATIVPQSFANRIQKGNPDDPLLLQVLPQPQEAESAAGFVADPLTEQQYGAQTGVLQKYAGRALVIAANHCVINCRYCFRRHFPYDQPINSKDWHQRLANVAQDPSITEIILSGGDPLAQTNSSLFALLDAIEAITHVTRVRIHSRLPIVLPERITPALCQRLQHSRLDVVMVVHSNHAQEFDTQVDMACFALKKANVTMLNQSVLLAGINNDAQTLADLSLRMFQAGMLPYYLHLPDAVKGTQHFYIDTHQGLGLFTQLQTLLPGYLVPRLVREEPGKLNKTLITKTLDA